LDELLGSSQQPSGTTNQPRTSGSVSGTFPLSHTSGSIVGTFQSPGLSLVRPLSPAAQLPSVPLHQSAFQHVFTMQTAAVSSSVLQNAATSLQPSSVFAPADTSKTDFVFSGELFLNIF